MKIPLKKTWSLLKYLRIPNEIYNTHPKDFELGKYYFTLTVPYITEEDFMLYYLIFPFNSGAENIIEYAVKIEIEDLDE